MPETDPPWWQRAVFYQIYPRSFADGNHDGVGDLPGITAHLDHVADLGADAIWLSPFFRSPMADFGYDVADYCDVDPQFGTLADFDALLARAHALGLKVVIDQVYSHSSDRHPWFQESRRTRSNPRADWYVWADAKPDGSPPNNWQSLFGGPAWRWDSHRRQYYLHNFLAQQPDLNLHNAEVQDALLDAARFWLDRGVDGFRLDVANFYTHDPALRDNPPADRPGGSGPPAKPYLFQQLIRSVNQPETFAFLARLRALMDGYGDRMTVAEIAGDETVRQQVEYVDGPDRLHTAYSFAFLRDAFSAPYLRDGVAAFPARSATAWPSWAFSNHDVPRVVTRWGGTRVPEADLPAFARTMLTLLLTLRGTPFLYQGEELGLPQGHVPFDRLRDPEAIAFWPEAIGRDGARTPIPWTHDRPHAGFSDAEPWLPADPAHGPLAVDLQRHDPGSTLAFAKRLLAYRRTRPALQTGDIAFLDGPGDLLAYERRLGSDRILCAFNTSGAPMMWTPPDGRWRTAPVDGLTGCVREGVLDLPPWSGLVAEPAA